jgi:hypothetical protein
MAWLKRLFVGRPLDTAESGEQKLSKKAALAVFSSDSLSSTALRRGDPAHLGCCRAASFALSVPAAIMIVALLRIVVTYSQTLDATPTGGGAYTVAKENLGVYPALIAGAALLIDYVLTVSVSVAAGVAPSSAVPLLYGYRIILGPLLHFAIMWANLRGAGIGGLVCGPFICLFFPRMSWARASLVTLGRPGPPHLSLQTEAANRLPSCFAARVCFPVHRADRIEAVATKCRLSAAGLPQRQDHPVRPGIPPRQHVPHGHVATRLRPGP